MPTPTPEAEEEMNERLRQLERIFKEDPTEENKFRWRTECVRQGRPELADLEDGDITLITLADDEDVVSKTYPAILGKTFRVKITRDEAFAVPVTEKGRNITIKGVTGFLIHPHDELTLILPHRPRKKR